MNNLPKPTADHTKKRVGIVGGGQLGKMMILEAKRLGLYIVTLDPTPSCPSHSISDEHIIAEFDSAKAYAQLATKVDVITYEFEHINAEVLELLEKQGHTIYPSVSSLKTIQNKYLQKQVLAKNSIAVPRFVLADSVSAIKSLGRSKTFSYPLMLKTTKGGYDGKGNALINDESEVEAAYQSLGGGKKELMVEEFINFDKEISVIACRGIDGTKVIYPVAENIHVNSILDTTIAPARISEKCAQKAMAVAEKVMEVFEGVGTFCVEMFVTKRGRIYVNEVAPRPHNSGHYTIEGCFANQFENHIRAIVGLPFGGVGLIQPTVMMNLLGGGAGRAALVGLDRVYLDPDIHIHIYGKEESKKHRKMGHLTVVDKTVESAIAKAQNAKKIVKVVGAE